MPNALTTLQTELPRLLKLAQDEGYDRVAQALQEALGGIEYDLDDERERRIDGDRDLMNRTRREA